MEHLKIIEKLHSSFENFLIPLRLGDGFLEKYFNEMCDVISEFNNAWNDSDSIPKEVADIFIDAYPAIHSASFQYSEEEAEKIQLAADKLSSLIRQCIT